MLRINCSSQHLFCALPAQDHFQTVLPAQGLAEPVQQNSSDQGRWSELTARHRVLPRQATGLYLQSQDREKGLPVQGHLGQGVDLFASSLTQLLQHAKGTGQYGRRVHCRSSMQNHLTFLHLPKWAPFCAGDKVARKCWRSARPIQEKSSPPITGKAIPQCRLHCHVEIEQHAHLLATAPDSRTFIMDWLACRVGGSE